MVNRNETNTARRHDTAHDLGSSALSSFNSRNPESKIPPVSDDVIVSLASAYENQRARQVTEWEQMRRQMVRRAA